MNEKKTITEPIIFQTSNGALELQTDNQIETIWANLDQISQLFNRDKSVVSRHIKNIFNEEELERNSTVAFFATVQKEGSREIKRNIEFYNLDLILSVGYRVNSKVATKFRQWATQTLKQHITKGFTINDSRIQKNKELFLKTIKDLKILSENTSLKDSKDLLSLIESFSNTWFSLDKFDKGIFPSVGSKLELVVNFSDLTKDIQLLKQELISKNEATELFAQEKQHGNLQGILGNVYQTIFGDDAYETIEEKAAHLLYFIVKNHPFNDGNKRTGAFTFIWFLRKAAFSFESKINPAALTTLTLLIAESDPSEKEKMIGIVLLLLGEK